MGCRTGAKPSGLQGRFGLSWERSSAVRIWFLWALLVAGAMATMDDKDLLAYFLTQYRQNLLTLLRKLNLREEEPLSSFIHLQDKKKEFKQMQKDREAKEEAFRERMKVIACRWKELCAEEVQLRSSAEKGERISKEDELPIQALQKASKERERTMQKENELWGAKKELEALRREHQKLYNKVKKCSTFNKNLEDMVKISQFEETQEVIWRYNTLLRVKKDLLQSQQWDQEMSAQAKVLLKRYKPELEAEILQYGNELEQLSECLDQTQKDVFLWETCWASIEDVTAEKVQWLGAIRMGVLNLFQSTSLQMAASLSIPADDSHAQLDMIQHFSEYSRDISVEAKQKTTRKRHRAARAAEL
ncbi:coiled-coil domain-containing protein 42 [Pogoniulus pusillus]|uniref:coiled-coil domain-containing protein 42 n=1 Tax=Pogoniulus pusillus TaxID=488313 RepID=UPI0030B9520B